MATDPVSVGEFDPAAAQGAVEATVVPIEPRLLTLAKHSGNIAEAMDAETLSRIGTEVVEDYEKDDLSRKEWKQIAEEMLAIASQDRPSEEKNTPWPNASNVNVPLLTTAALQYNARMYPAAIKGDEAVLCKVIGQDNGVPEMAPNPRSGQMQPVPLLDEAGNPVPGPNGEPLQPVWKVPPGAKSKRAKRVAEYLNTTIFYRMEGWEADTDALLMQKPIVGCVFRKVWFDPDKGVQAAMVPALRLVVNENVRSLTSAPRVTEEMPDIFPQEIYCKQREGKYLDVDLGITDDTEDKPRLLLEQHRWLDLDEDGYDEPYIVTVDKETALVLRVEANFSPRDIKWDASGTKALRITPGRFYVKYGFFPHPQGKFYDLGLGHLLKKLGSTVDTTLNQLIDAGTARTSGGGFMAAGLRLQGRAGRSVVRFQPGEYKTVEISGDDIRKAIVDRTIPEVSPVTFQVLDLILGFAKEVAGTKDILTGDVNATAPVGTVLALIEQGLQVFNAVAKRFFRSARDEYQLLKEKIGRYGGEAAAEDYRNVLDDPEADFAADFNSKDMDIRPVSDPANVTRMQKMARAQYIESKIPLLAQLGGDAREALRRVFEAADVEDIDKLLPPLKPAPPDPKAVAEVDLTKAKTVETLAKADKINAEAVETAVEGQDKKYQLEKRAMGDGIEAAAI